MGCTNIECQANRIRSGHYQKESKRWKESFYKKGEQLKIANDRIDELVEKVLINRRLVVALRNVAYEYDRDWRINSPRWERYVESLKVQQSEKE